MTSTDTAAQSRRALTVTPDQLRAALERKFRMTPAPGFPARLLVPDTKVAEVAIDLAMQAIEPVLEARDADRRAKDAEIARLRERVAELERMAVIGEPTAKTVGI